eukprot:jgi/Orpsp1_1/1176128/evm.model.c7180000056512.1
MNFHFFIFLIFLLFGLDISIAAQCGKDNGLSCKPGYCCSKYGYCGTSSKYCDEGCQPKY